MKTTAKLFAAAAVLVASGVMATTTTADGDHPGLTPESVSELILPGQSFSLEKTVHTPAIPPDPEIYFLVDTTGSMFDVLDQVETDIASIITAVEAAQPTAEFGLGQYKDFPFDAFAYQHEVSIGGDVAAAVGTLTAGGGADGSEGQFYALDRIANTPIAGFSGDAMSTPIIVWIGDAPAHDPVCGSLSGLGYDITEATVTADLLDAGYTVVAVSTTTGFLDGLDDDPDAFAGDYPLTDAACLPNGDPGQATRITGATGGDALKDVAPADVAQAILDALAAIEVEVSMASDCTAPIHTTFSPDSVVVESGDHAVFTETISVDANAAGGVYECRDYALIDGAPMVGPDGAVIYEYKTIYAPQHFVTGGGHITNGEKGKDRATVLNFGGNAGYMPDGTLVGHWHFDFKDEGVKINTTEITALQFFDFGLEPAPPEVEADTAAMVATARVSVDNGPWTEGCTVHAVFQDDGEPQNDTLLSFDVDCGTGAFVWEGLTGGNIQIHYGTK